MIFDFIILFLIKRVNFAKKIIYKGSIKNDVKKIYLKTGTFLSSLFLLRSLQKFFKLFFENLVGSLLSFNIFFVGLFALLFVACVFVCLFVCCVCLFVCVCVCLFVFANTRESQQHLTIAVAKPPHAGGQNHTKTLTTP